MGHAYRNTIIFVILILAGVQWGFYYSYTSKFPEFKGITNLTHVHGMLMMTWLMLLIIQPFLILTGRQKLHRIIGKSSYVIGPLIIISLFLIGRQGYNGLVKDNPAQLAREISVLDIRGFLTFGVFWALAMINRKNSDTHMRYMIGTAILAIGPGIGRGLMAAFNLDLVVSLTITDCIDIAIVGILLGFDIRRNRNYRPYLTILLIFIASAILWQIRTTAPWQAFSGAWAALFF